MRVKISKDDKVGFVNYTPETKELIVEFPVANDKRNIIKYLTKKKKFKIPESQRIDDYRIDIMLPTENLMYMELALCELYTHTGVWVNWEELSGGSDEIENN
jgi:hypothetical protein